MALLEDMCHWSWALRFSEAHTWPSVFLLEYWPMNKDICLRDCSCITLTCPLLLCPCHDDKELTL